MQSALLVIHVLLSLALIGLVLIQQGKGADAGAAFGGGASSTMFGSSGAGTFLTKLTTGLAIAFFVTSLGLAYLSASDVADSSLVEQLEEQKQENIETDLSNDLPAASEQESSDLPLPSGEQGAADLPAGG